ncbi:RING finger 10, partial [Paramuricea clavata]
MGDGLQNMEGASQHVRPSRQANNSPIPQRQGNSQKSLVKGKNGQIKSQKFAKGGRGASFANCQKNTYPDQGRARGGQYPLRKRGFTDKRPPTQGLRQTERFNPLAVQDGEMQHDYNIHATSKKDSTSLNYLLNFTYAPLQQTHHVWSGRRKAGGKWNQYNKEQFLQANCQFVVHAGGNYTVNFVDPDVIVDWELIEQVRVRCREMPSCPICLYPPTAAQITRCGHIYCWSCILHYLSLSGKTWRKCPICYESIHQKDLKSVMAVAECTYSIGQEITMTLMKRAKDSLLTMPNMKWSERTSIPQLSSDEVEMQFSKLLIASPLDILNQIMDNYRIELKNQLIEVENDKSGEEEFVKLAIEQFEEREKKLLDICDKEPKVISTDSGETSNPILVPLLEDTSGTMSTQGESVDKLVNKDCIREALPSGAENSSNEVVPCHISISSGDSTCSSLSSENAQFYYFYQAEDGQHIFLHPINARCLIKEYGSLEHCPQTIAGNIVEMECHTQTEELRRRFRYLRHLPLTCEFVICELDLKQPVVSWGTLSYFKDDLCKRRLRRQKKAKEEARHDNKCKSKMTSFTGIKQPQTENVTIETPNLDSEQDFPQQVASSPTVWIASSPRTQGPWSNAGRDQENVAFGTSFAK